MRLFSVALGRFGARYKVGTKPPNSLWKEIQTVPERGIWHFARTGGKILCQMIDKNTGIPVTNIFTKVEKGSY